MDNKDKNVEPTREMLRGRRHKLVYDIEQRFSSSTLNTRDLQLHRHNNKADRIAKKGGIDKKP